MLSNFMGQRGDVFKAAIVTSDAVDFQLLKMYITLLQRIGSFHMRLFRDLPEANAWVDARSRIAS